MKGILDKICKNLRLTLSIFASRIFCWSTGAKIIAVVPDAQEEKERPAKCQIGFRNFSKNRLEAHGQDLMINPFLAPIFPTLNKEEKEQAIIFSPSCIEYNEDKYLYLNGIQYWWHV